MIRAIVNKRLDLNDEEFAYYNHLKNTFGEEQFKGIFSTDAKGNIISIAPSTTNPTSMAVLFFLLNVMLNQRLRGIDKILNRIDGFDKRLKRLEAGKNTKTGRKK